MVSLTARRFRSVARGGEALAALHALQLHRDSAEICRQIAEAVDLRREHKLKEEYLRRFRLK